MAPKVNIPKDTAANKNLRTTGKGYAAKQIKKTFASSKIRDRSSDFPQFQISEVTLGKVLGKGGFGTVYEVRGFEAGKIAKAASTEGHEQPYQEMESRKFISDHCIRKGGDARYALKMLSPEVIADPSTFIQGIIDMAVETRVLSDVEHPNIVRMRACAQTTPFDEQYFLVMDRLYDTLESRMDKWAKLNKRFSGMGAKLLDRNGLKKQAILEKKLVAAFDLCAVSKHYWICLARGVFAECLLR